MRGATSLKLLQTVYGTIFQSTLLMRGATRHPHFRVVAAIFQSTLLMRGATRLMHLFLYAEDISIHAPHARSDCIGSVKAQAGRISIHAPHARSDLERLHASRGDENFNPRSSCEERHYEQYRDKSELITFQSTLLMRGATRMSPTANSDGGFQSTLLMRGATQYAR